MDKPEWAPSMTTWIDELLEAGVEDGNGKKATRKALERLASDYTGDFILLYGELKNRQVQTTMTSGHRLKGNKPNG